MENELMNKFIDELEIELDNFSKQERKEIIKDIKKQIQEKQSETNLPMSVILNRLGSPRELASTYGVIKTEDSHSYTPGSMMESYVFYGLTGKVKS